MKIIIIPVVLFTLALYGCGSFPTKFGNVQKDEFRVLDFVYEPAEAAPGDTVNVKAIFAGKKISVADIDWKISFNVVTNMYGSTDTAFDYRPFTVRETHFSNETTCMEWSFVIPKDILYTSGGIPSNWVSIIPSAYKQDIPAEYLSLTKKQMLDTMAILTSLSPQILSLVAQANPGLADIVPFMCQFLTVKSRIQGQIKNDYLIESDYTIRQNKKFASVPELGVNVNRNPVIDSVGIYKVEGNVKDYDPKTNKHTFYRLDVPVGQEMVIPIEKDYSYFVEVFSENPDTSRSLLDIQKGTSKVENYFAKWFFAMDSAEVANVNYTEFMDISGDDLLVFFLPPANGAIKKFTVWAQVYDDMMNEVQRPIGSKLIEGRGVFQYSQEYLDQFKK